MTDAGKVQVWSATWLAWGAPYSITGSAALDARFPGHWFQLEAGLHYNWHRHYDPAIGRYTQPDPLGFVDGPSVYGYVRNNPLKHVDKDGRAIALPLPPVLIPLIPPAIYCSFYPEKCKKFADQCRTLFKKTFGGGGANNDDDDDPCAKQQEQDFETCRRLANMTPAQKGVRARCFDSADGRYGACRAGKSLPPLITW